MQVINNLDFQLNHTAVCIGKFDGLHRGHRLLLKEAARNGEIVTMITFVFPNAKGIYSFEEKKDLAQKLGVEVFIAISLTDSFMHMSAEDFVKEILLKKCDAKKVVVGADFCFGYQRSGDARFLRQAGQRYGFETVVLEKLMQDGEIISSTGIRERLRKGQIRQVNSLLETPYFIQGEVVAGNQIGRTMGIPTANIRPDVTKELPPLGVYTVQLEIDTKNSDRPRIYQGVANLGTKPTVTDHREITLEVWLFDFEGDLYEKKITVYFLDYQRPEKKFPSLDALREQIQKDTQRAKEFLEAL